MLLEYLFGKSMNDSEKIIPVRKYVRTYGTTLVTDIEEVNNLCTIVSTYTRTSTYSNVMMYSNPEKSLNTL